MTFNQSVNRFRAGRGRLLAQQIADLSRILGRPIAILDVGGRPDYWLNVKTENVERIDLLNLDPIERDEHLADLPSGGAVSFLVGDARNLSAFPDKSVDLVHSNSVIEHVGRWEDMASMAREALRVGRSGWIQTPAWEFPVESHFHAPFVHWVRKSIGVHLFSVSLLKWCREADRQTRHWQMDHVHLLSRREVSRLFPDCQLMVERLVVPKSYVARWMPAA